MTPVELKRQIAWVKSLRLQWTKIAARVAVYGDRPEGEQARQYLARLGARVEKLEATVKRRQLIAARDAQAQQSYELPADPSADLREQIREQRGFHQSTAGPPEPGSETETTPPGDDRGAVPNDSLCDLPKTSTANVIRIADFAKSDFSERSSCARNLSAETAMRDLNPEGVADDDQHKTRH